MSDLAITKAAAWAWLQHGPGPLDSSNPKYELTRAQRAHGPSRYKLEAGNVKVQTREGSRLLDRYEIDTISKHIDDYVEVNKHEAKSEKKSGKKTKNKNNNGKGFGSFWLNGIVCVPREGDVVELVRRKSVNVENESSGVKMKDGIGLGGPCRPFSTRNERPPERVALSLDTIRGRRQRPISMLQPTIGLK